MIRWIGALVVVSCMALVHSPSRAASVPVTTCGQQIDGRAHLTGDLTCPLGDGFAVRLFQGGTLEMNGFTLTATEGGAIHCYGACRIFGPGTIVAAAQALSGGNVRTRDLAIEANQIAGTFRMRNTDFQQTGPVLGTAASCGRAHLIDSTISAAAGADSGLRCTDGVKLVRSSVSGFEEIGVESSSSRVRLVDSTVTGALCGTTDCADIISSDKPRLRGTSTCGTSWRPAFGGGPGATWGVCAND